jgi:regulatory protein
MPKRGLGTSEALDLAARALAHRDLSTVELRERLERRGIGAEQQDRALATLERAGVLDDARFACSRAAALAARGYGNAAIEADLERRGIDPALRSAALERLESEPERARAVLERRGAGARTTRYLLSRGFDREAAETASGGAFAPEP